MRYDKLKNFLVPALLLCVLLFAPACGGGPDNGPIRPAPPRTVEQDISDAKSEIHWDGQRIKQLEKELKDAKDEVWTPPPGIEAPQSLQDKIEKVEHIKKKLERAKRKLQRDKSRLDRLEKEKQSSEGGHGC